MRLAGRVALVTGASRGLGRAIAEALAGEGASVIVNSRQSAEAAEAVAASLASGGTHAVIQGDVSDPAGAAQLFDQVNRRYGRLDMLVNNAGWTRDVAPVDLASISEVDLRRMVDTNVIAVFRACLLALDLMRRTREQEGPDWRGHIVNISSNAVRTRTASNLFYIATKAAVNSLTQTFALHFGDIARVNAIAPGLVRTDLTAGASPNRFATVLQATPLGRLGRSEDIAGAVLALSCEMTFVTGQIIAVDGGRTTS